MKCHNFSAGGQETGLGLKVFSSFSHQDTLSSPEIEHGSLQIGELQPAIAQFTAFCHQITCVMKCPYSSRQQDAREGQQFSSKAAYGAAEVLC